jgi:hypothetical protein
MLNSYIQSVGNLPTHPYLDDKNDTRGPDELADVVIHDLSGMDKILGITSPHCYFSNSDNHWLTEGGLRQLIKESYYASLLPEEGRYPRVSFFWSIYQHEWFDIGELTNEEHITVEKIRKLAPICQNQTMAIRVKLIDGILKTTGITALNYEGLDVHLGRPGFALGGRELNIQVHILGPGHIRVDIGTFEYELRAGRIRQCTELRSLPSIRKLTNEFSAKVGKEVIEKKAASDEDAKLFGGLENCFDNCHLLELVLRPIIHAGHGGSLLIVSRNDLDRLIDQELIISQRVANLDLLKLAAEHLGECIDFWSTRENLSENSRFRRWIQTRGRLASSANAIGGLSSVDGCVVLTRDLSVVGFGVKINVSREEARDSQIQFRNAVNNTVVEFDELEKVGGMRFQSAMRFCKKHPNALAFVISQDRDMKVLWSDENNAFAFGPVTISSIPIFR